MPEAERMWSAEYDEVAPLLEKALAKERAAGDPVAAVTGAAAEGVARAAKLLAGKYTLVATNVPYLATRQAGRRSLRDYLRTALSGRKGRSWQRLSRTVPRVHDRTAGTTFACHPAELAVPGIICKLRRQLLARADMEHASCWLGSGSVSRRISGEVVKPALA